MVNFLKFFYVIHPRKHFLRLVVRYRQFSIIRHSILRHLRHPSLILGNRCNAFHLKVIRLFVTFYRQQRDDGLSNIVCKRFPRISDGWRGWRSIEWLIIENCQYFDYFSIILVTFLTILDKKLKKFLSIQDYDIFPVIYS